MSKKRRKNTELSKKVYKRGKFPLLHTANAVEKKVVENVVASLGKILPKRVECRHGEKCWRKFVSNNTVGNLCRKIMAKNTDENLCRKFVSFTVMSKNCVENRVKKYLKYSVIFKNTVYNISIDGTARQQTARQQGSKKNIFKIRNHF